MRIVRCFKPGTKAPGVVAFFDVELEGIIVSGFALMRDGAEYFIRYPMKKDARGRWWPTAAPSNGKSATSLLSALKNELLRHEVGVVRTEADQKLYQNENHERRLELTREEKINISRRYLDDGFAGSRDAIQRMRGQHFREMRTRSLGNDE